MDQESKALDMFIARTQRAVTVITLLLIACALIAIFLLPSIDSGVEKLGMFVLGALTANLATQNGFWYGRPRGGVPDPRKHEP